jgi:hypothetical protein
MASPRLFSLTRTPLRAHINQPADEDPRARGRIHSLG